jgi:hypothetical protein
MSGGVATRVELDALARILVAETPPAGSLH